MIFLADGEDVFRIFMVVVFMFVSFMGWVGQFMKNRQQGAKRNRPQPRQDGNVSTEIERFLEEVTGNKAKRPEQRAEPVQRVEAQRRRESETPAAKPQARRRPKRRETSDTKPLQPRPVSESTATRSQSSSSQRVPPKASARVSAPDSGLSVPPRRSSSAPQARDLITTLGPNLAEQLSSPEKVRQAIVLNMILGPPRSKDPSFVRKPGVAEGK